MGGKLTKFPIAGLTTPQRVTFEQIGSGNSAAQGCSRKTIESLLKRGLIEPCGDKIVHQDRFGVVRVPQYQVPIHLHIQWCEWCAKREDV